MEISDLGERITRGDLGLPEAWRDIEEWIDDSRSVACSVQATHKLTDLKNVEIDCLETYAGLAPNSFWYKFPKYYPKKQVSTIKVRRLKFYVRKCWFRWTRSQRRFARKALQRLKGSEKVVLKRELGGINTRNAKSAVENGKHMTDAICSWVKKKFVAGPFGKKPLQNFRVNPLMAAVQKTKVRPIMNLSSPKGRSFNDAVDMGCIDKLKMSSPKLFAEGLVNAGKGAVFSKTDIMDAYKLIPNAVDQWRLYGFEWLGKFFYDTRTVFGSRAAPAFFDSLPETLVNIVCCLENVPKRFVHRQLDDVPIVSPEDSEITERFTARYAELCKELNVPLAESCPNHEKAFGPSTHGTVLGINFDSTLMEWSISAEKESDLQQQIDEFLNKKTCTLKEVQKLQGKIAILAQMCEFMRSY
jgi:hypothetical protein